jgi:hypothetical protein
VPFTSIPDYHPSATCHGKLSENGWTNGLTGGKVENMKVQVSAILLLLSLAIGCKTGSSNRFAIYLTAERVVEPDRLHIADGYFAALRNEGVTSTNDWTNVALIEPPVISEKDIVAVDFSTGLMKVMPAAVERIVERIPVIPSEGRQFVLMVNKQRIFLGNFWTYVSSASTETPTIVPFPRFERELFLREGAVTNKNDPGRWSDPRILQSLERLHKVGHVNWDADDALVGSTNSQAH